MANTSNRVKLTDYLLGQQSGTQGRNYVINPSGFENVNNVAVGGSATVSQNTSTPLTAISDFQIALTNDTTDSVTWTLNTLDNSLNGQNCMLSFDYTASSMGSAVQAQVLQGSNVAAYVVLSAQSTSKNVILNVPCGSLGSATTVAIKNVTGNSGASALHVANITYGKATNISQINQAQFLGSINWVATTSCTWNITSTGSYVAFAANTSCPTPTVSGNAVAPSTKVPEIDFTSAPAGVYYLVARGSFGQNSGSGVTSSGFRFYEATSGTASSDEAVVNQNSGNTLFIPTITGQIVLTSAVSNAKFQIQGVVLNGSSNAAIQNNATAASPQSFEIDVYYFPSASQIAVNSNASPVAASYYVSTNTSTTGGNPINFQTALFDTGCSGSCVTTGTSWRFTAPFSGYYQVNTTLYNAAGTTNVHLYKNGSHYVLLALTNTSSLPQASSALVQLNAGDYIDLRPDGTITTQSGGPLGSPIYEVISVFMTTGYQAAPILVGSVTSTTTGQEHIERAHFGSGSEASPGSCTSSPCTILSQSGSWLTSVTRSNTGLYAFNIAAGEFSSYPSCFFTVGQSNTRGYCSGDGNPTSSTGTLLCYNTSNSAQDTDVYIMCMGPH
jgi:hypothetical protein